MVINIKIEAMVFDFGNVLMKSDSMEICKKLALFSQLKFSAEKIYQLIFNPELSGVYERGIIASKFFWQNVSLTIGASYSSLTFEKFSELWNSTYSEEPDSGIDETLVRICPEIKMLLISNTDELHWQHHENLFTIKEFFPKSENLILSFREHLLKPARAIYELAIKKAQCHPNQILYIDDNPDFVNAFCNLGVRGIVYDCSKESIIQLYKKLRPYGVFI